MSHLKGARLSVEFRQIEGLCDEKVPVTLGYILNHLEHRGHALLTLFLAGPFLIPLPLPGLSVPFGVFIAFFAFSMAFERKPFLPRRWLLREIPRPTLIKFCQLAQKFFGKFERLFKPRMVYLVDSRTSRFVIATLIALGGILLALPLPPGTNSPPSSVVIALSIGYLERDGVLILIGYGLFLLNVVFFGALGIYGYEGAIKLFHFLAETMHNYF